MNIQTRINNESSRALKKLTRKGLIELRQENARNLMRIRVNQGYDRAKSLLRTCIELTNKQLTNI